MFIRWTGNGIAAPLIIGIGAFGVTNMTKAIYGSSYIHSHPWVPWLGVSLGGLLCWWSGVSYDNEASQALVDEKTRQRVILRKTHTLYGIPMQWWGLAAMVGGLLVAVMGSHVPSAARRNSPAGNPLAARETDPAVNPPTNSLANRTASPVADLPENPTANPPASPDTNPAPNAAPVSQQIPLPADASPEQTAIRLYPALGVAGSPFNTRFLELQKKYAAERPDYFRDPDWPITLAREVAESSH